MKKIVFGFDHEGSLKKVRESPSRWPTKVEDAKLFSVPLSQARHSLGLSLSLSCPFFDLNFAISGSDTAVLSIREDCVDLRGARERERESARKRRACFKRNLLKTELFGYSNGSASEQN